MPASEGCVLIFGRRSRISLVVVVVDSTEAAEERVVGARGAKLLVREGRRGVRMLKVLWGG
jgi:hypothetical protein